MNKLKPIAAALVASVLLPTTALARYLGKTPCWNNLPENTRANGEMIQMSCDLSFVSKNDPSNSYGRYYWQLGSVKILEYPQEKRALLISKTGVRTWWDWSVDKHLDLVYSSDGTIISFRPPEHIKEVLKANGYGQTNGARPANYRPRRQPQDVLSDTPFRF